METKYKFAKHNSQVTERPEDVWLGVDGRINIKSCIQNAIQEFDIELNSLLVSSNPFRTD